MEPQPPNNTPYDHSIYIASLIYKVMEKEGLSVKEQDDLDGWLGENELHVRAYAELRDRGVIVGELKRLDGYDTKEAARRLFKELGIEGTPAGARVLHPIRRWTAAAAIVVLLATGAWWLSKEKRVPSPTAVLHEDVAPGGNKAILTLADGRKITLDSVQSGQLAIQGGTKISGRNGQVEYDLSSVKDAAHPGTTAYNTIATPRGGQYRLVLPDGSKVLLNAASTLRYPVAFTGRDRTVELSGEAYFTVARQVAQPFIVRTKNIDVTVLGTEFDLMAYVDEPGERTTLINGAVRVKAGTQVRTLTPGQQAFLDQSGLVVQDADTDKETAWTTGFFQFGHTDIRTIMREIARWYDIDVVYQATMNDSDTYSGRISRNLPLSDLTTFLEGNGIHHFRIEGRKLIVLP